MKNEKWTYSMVDVHENPPNKEFIIEDEDETRVIATVHGNREDNARLIASAPEMLEALTYYKEGIDHFYKCMNFKMSFMDAKAIAFMNESNIKITRALASAQPKSNG